MIVYNQMKYLLTLIISLISLVISQKALIFSSSVGYYNYRQNANALRVYHFLKNNGIDDADMVLAFPENVGCC